MGTHSSTEVRSTFAEFAMARIVFIGSPLIDWFRRYLIHPVMMVIIVIKCSHAQGG